MRALHFRKLSHLITRRNTEQVRVWFYLLKALDLSDKCPELRLYCPGGQHKLEGWGENHCSSVTD